MENRFRPYIIVSDSPMGLRLKPPASRVWVAIIAWRILPFIILGLTIFIATEEFDEFPLYVLAGLFLICVVAIYLFTIKVVSGVLVNSTFIEVKTISVIGVRTTEYFISQARFIQIQISDYIRGGAVRYKLVLKNNESVQFMNQPTLLVKRQDVELVASTFKSLTHLETKVVGTFNGER